MTVEDLQVTAVLANNGREARRLIALGESPYDFGFRYCALCGGYYWKNEWVLDSIGRPSCPKHMKLLRSTSHGKHGRKRRATFQ